MFLWRVIRAVRLHMLFLLSICIFATLNLLFFSLQKRSSVENHINHGILNSRQFIFEEDSTLTQNLDPSGHPKVVFSQLFSGGEQLTSSPVVKKELSFGVHEEENSAREVLDGEANEKEIKGNVVDANAANEVNSVEPETSVLKNGVDAADTAKDDDKDEQEEAEHSFHQLPPQLGDENRVENYKSPWESGHTWRNLSDNETDSLSVLGRRLFLEEKIGTEKNRTFTVLVWKHGRNIERRLLKEYGKEKQDPFRKCSVHNCKLTYEDIAADTADAILFHLHLTKGPHTFPKRTKLNQRWIWLTDESPYYTFMVAKNKNMADYNGYFNWSMSYRMDSDIPVPYGRTVQMTPEETSSYQYIDYFKLKTKTVAILGSNCGGKNKRWNYVRELKKHIDVDVYGRCGTLKCPGHFTKDCTALDDYKFYLAFENGDCSEYITEKVWWNALGKGAVPVVMGSKIQDYKKLLPPDSFININEFPTPQHLAKYLMYLASDSVAYNRFHAWRSRYRVLNEHGYFASEVFHYCRICEALNYNDPKPKTYNDLEVFWSKATQCYPPTWEEKLRQNQLKTPGYSI